MGNFSVVLGDALRAKETVIISANCSISYSGRAESFLASGDRLIIIKQDGTLLVHQPKGAQPVNYMKEAVHELRKGKKGWILQSKGLASKEFMEISLQHVHSITSQNLLDAERIVLQGTEKDMSDMIFTNPALIGPHFKPLSREEHTKYGFIDVFGYDGKGVLTVVECKRDKADFSAIHQLERYVEKIKTSKGLSSVKGIIAAPSISTNAEALLKEKGYSFVSIKPPKFLERHSKGQARLGDF